MKLAIAIRVIVAAVLPVVLAWDEDPRCLDKRRKLAHNSTNSSSEPIIREYPRLDTNDDSGLLPVAHNVSIPGTSPLSRLRGSRQYDYHRNLEDITTFQLKMYWEEGYCWQDEWKERKWCLECEGSSCGAGDYLWIQYCDKDEKEQRFIYRPLSGTSGGHLSPYERQDLCWQRTRTNAHQLRKCNKDESKQIIVGIKFNDKFEMHPNGRSDDCLEQHHDPKREEIVRANDCSEARKDHTNFWIMINKKTGKLDGGGGGGGDDDDDGDQPPGSDTINYLASDYCNTRRCRLCQGDCDGDGQCEQGLKCFQRSGNEPVPGCKGGDDSKTRIGGKDFCYKPPSDGDDDDDEQPPGSDKINYLGRDYCTRSRPCRKCQGDCDRDTHCEQGLKCFQRSGNEAVPGCKGGDDPTTHGKDFCYKPPSDGDDDDNEQPPGSNKINYLGRDYCTRSRPCRKCQGDCDSDNGCNGELVCFQRSGNQAVPGCSGGTGSDTHGKDFCVRPQDIGNDGDDDDNDQPPGSTEIKYLGRDYCTSSRPCKECFGDCDNNRGCEGSLECFQRSGNEPVPGCSGGEGDDTKGKDFCYRP